MVKIDWNNRKQRNAYVARRMAAKRANVPTPSARWVAIVQKFLPGIDDRRIWKVRP